MALGNLAQRALVAVVAAPLLIFTFYLGRPEPTWAIVFVASLLAQNELLVMGLREHTVDRRPMLIVGGLACALLYWAHPAGLGQWWHSAHALPVFATGPLLAMMLGVVGPGLYYLFRYRDMQSAATRWAFAITAIFYCGFTATTLAMTKRDFGAQGGDFVLMILLLAWIGDTGAYFAGRFLGKHKLYPEVSPKKTWEGAVGGLVGSLGAVAVMKLVRLESLSWLDVVLLAIPGGILGQLGDLVESLIKRSVGVKDSGALLPGHGGMLDRIDAVLFIAPYVYFYRSIFG